MMDIFKNSFGLFFAVLAALLFCAPERSLAQDSSPILIRDTEIENILREWGRPVFEAARLNPNSIHLILVQSDTVNAFVAGGDNIFLYTGLISKAENPGELIGVIAHETGHISGGHLIRGREAMERASYESIIGTLIGIGAAVASGDSGAASALSLGGNSIAQRRYLAHSRVHESSADQAALTFLEAAKINPTGLASFMGKLKAENYVPVSQQSEYIQTHPLVDNRVEMMERRIADSRYKSTPYPDRWLEQHARMKAKLVGFIHPEQVPWTYDDRDDSVAAQYARTIAAYRENKVEDALGKIDTLLELESQNPYFLELKGQMLVEFSRVTEAVPYYREAIALLPDATLFRIALAHALIESARENQKSLLVEATDQLERSLRDESRSARVHRLLATAYGRLGEENKAKLHLAEEAVLQRRFPYAMQHARDVLAQEKKGSTLWIQAKDIISFIETAKKG